MDNILINFQQVIVDEPRLTISLTDFVIGLLGPCYFLYSLCFIYILLLSR